MTKTTLRRHRAEEALLLEPCVRPRGVPAAPLHTRPGIAADVLAELRAETATPTPTALRHAFDRNTWVPNLRAVPLVGIDENLAAIRAHLDQAPALRHEDALVTALAAISEQLERAL